MPITHVDTEKAASITFTTVVDDIWTVEVNFEGSDLLLILQQLYSSEQGRKFLAILYKALMGIRPFMDEEMQRKAEEEIEKLKAEARREAYEFILAKARAKGLDLRLLFGEEVENELFRTKKEEKEDSAAAQED